MSGVPATPVSSPRSARRVRGEEHEAQVEEQVGDLGGGDQVATPVALDGLVDEAGELVAEVFHGRLPGDARYQSNLAPDGFMPVTGR